MYTLKSGVVLHTILSDAHILTQPQKQSQISRSALPSTSVPQNPSSSTVIYEYFLAFYLCSVGSSYSNMATDVC